MLVGRVCEFLSQKISPMRFQNERGGIHITVFITCAIPLFCLSGGASYLLFGQHYYCNNINSTYENVWKPEIALSDRYSVQLKIQFPISYQFLNNLAIKNGSTVIATVSGARNICRMRHVLLKCQIGLIQNCTYGKGISYNESLALEKILDSIIIC